MKRHSVMMAVLALGWAGSAQAAPRATYVWTDPSLLHAKWQPPAADTVSHVIYLNNCQPNGCQLHPGNNDATQNYSSIPQGDVTVSAYQGSSSEWAQIVQCVQQTYAPFNVQVVTTRPASGNYHMAIVAGAASEVGQPQGVLGVSPFSCGYIPNSISFTFANEEPSGIYDLCWTVSQETAHSWGLDHKYDDKDPMTYLQTGPSWKQFQNAAGACGEYQSRNCNCTYDQTGNAQENSYALVMATFGSSAPDTTPPTVKITSPANGASVQPGFSITADINDDVAIAKAELKIDGMSAGVLMAGPFQWNAPSTLGMGTHTIEVDGYDLSNNMASDMITVTYGHACTKASDCSDSTDVCLGGRCVPGPNAPGGLGTTCTANSDCASNQCADDGTHKYCVDGCDTTKSGSCPSGFGCTAVGTGGVCWPGANNGGGGGCDTHGGAGPLFAMLALVGMLITRRRR